MVGYGVSMLQRMGMQEWKSHIYNMQMILFIFSDAEEKQLKILRIIFILFEATSGLHINWRKSHIFPINEVNRNQQLIEVLGGEIGQLPTIYLGMPLGAKSKVRDLE